MDLARTLQAQAGLESIVVLDPTSPVPDGLPDVLAGIRELEDAPPLRVVPRGPDRVAAVNFTSGTTGKPKGVVFTHGTLATSAQGSINWNDIRCDDVNLACISMFHSGGVHDCVKWVMVGATIIWAGGWDAERVAQLLIDRRPTWIGFMVPTMFRGLMALPQWGDLPLDGVRVSIGGEPVPGPMQQELLARGMKPINAYGMTETMPVAALQGNISYDDYLDVPVGSSGRPNEEFCEVKVIDPLDGTEVTSPGVQGEICLRGPVVTTGYLNPADTERSFDADGWLHTNDLASFDENGWFFVGGRTDEIINSGGEKLSLTIVEDELFRSPLVEDVACIGATHERYGQCPVALIVPSKDLPAEDIRDELESHCLSSMERWMRPRLYIVVDAIPRTAAKRSKDVGALRARVAELTVTDSPTAAVIDDREAATG